MAIAFDSARPRRLLILPALFDEANKLRDRVKNAGFAVFVEPVGQGAERLWRVRVGPEADRSNAEKTRDAIKAKLALNGTVVTQS